MLCYGHEKQQHFRKLNKSKTIGAPAMAPPELEKKFELYVGVKQDQATGILMLKCLVQRPEWPHCLQNCAATALMGPEA